MTTNQTDPFPAFETSPTPGELGMPSRRPKRRIVLPILLFAATCLSTTWVGGWPYAVCLMFILTAHELGHFLQAMRYRVPASLPYFIPMPIAPVGTMGAVILAQPGMGHRRALFDIAITGPLAGLVPALVFSIIGLRLSQVTAIPNTPNTIMLGEPIVFKLLARLVHGALPEGQDIILHPIALAGWVGIFITALNLIPIGQLDGGHVLYALLRRRAHFVAKGLLVSAVLAVALLGYLVWIPMIILLWLMGPVHPPTSNDGMPLGSGRTVLGYAVLLFMPLGFTPMPFYVPSDQSTKAQAQQAIVSPPGQRHDAVQREVDRNWRAGVALSETADRQAFGDLQVDGRVRLAGRMKEAARKAIPPGPRSAKTALETVCERET